VGYRKRTSASQKGGDHRGTAVGFVAGLLIPSTRVEDERIGPMADQLKEQAKETGQEAMERGKHVAQQAAETAKEEGQKQADALRDSAQDKVGSAGGSS
jgi:gas vesicle protein